MTVMDEKVDLRCPVTPRRLFGRLKAKQATITDANTIEFACDDCRRALRGMGETVSLVLHEYNLLGECVQTVKRP